MPSGGDAGLRARARRAPPCVDTLSTRPPRTQPHLHGLEMFFGAVSNALKIVLRRTKDQGPKDQDDTPVRSPRRGSELYGCGVRASLLLGGALAATYVFAAVDARGAARRRFGVPNLTNRTANEASDRRPARAGVEGGRRRLDPSAACWPEPPDPPRPRRQRTLRMVERRAANVHPGTHRGNRTHRAAAVRRTASPIGHRRIKSRASRAGPHHRTRRRRPTASSVAPAGQRGERGASTMPDPSASNGDRARDILRRARVPSRGEFGSIPCRWCRGGVVIRQSPRPN